MPHHDDRENRKDLGKEHPWGDRGQVLFFVVFLAVWILDSFILRISTFLANYIPLWVTLPIAGIMIIGAAYFIRKAEETVFKEIRDPPRVINSGVFARVRHPMYLGTILFLLALGVATCSLFSLAVWGLMFVFFDRIAAFEEQDLEQIFGQEYVEYKRIVPKWIPRLRRA
ncbi:MAG TPA: isoprenylcysteine carboxylmethyltransferase family protein [Candidatus Lokiarchaeia archaeon]|nr:isoprenylcysteine carboxylmethyltransferase family protein [Candidatus Lokiarchaeia archaeon]